MHRENLDVYGMLPLIPPLERETKLSWGVTRWVWSEHAPSRTTFKALATALHNSHLTTRQPIVIKRPRKHATEVVLLQVLTWSTVVLSLRGLRTSVHFTVCL